MKKFCLALLMLLLGSTLAYAQGRMHRCEVSITDLNIDDKIKLGSFTTMVKAESLVTKAFRFPGTELFVTASVLYMQESPFLAGTPASEMIITLVLSKKAYSAIESEMKKEDVITNATSVVPLKSFERARIETIYLGKKQPMIIELECQIPA
jgi:hypothetical protein